MHLILFNGLEGRFDKICPVWLLYRSFVIRVEITAVCLMVSATRKEFALSLYGYFLIAGFSTTQPSLL